MLNLLDRCCHDPQNRKEKRKIADHGGNKESGDEAVTEQDKDDRDQGHDRIGLDIIGGDPDKGAQPGGFSASDPHAEGQENGDQLT